MSDLRIKIAAEIAQEGSIPFARFMTRALYEPSEGYYERPLEVGKAGDFYTSVSVGKVFGDLLASRFAGWLTEWRDGDSRQIVETGAHDGQLAADILAKLSLLGVSAKIQYWIVEPSEVRRQLQQHTLHEFGGRVHWFKDIHDVPPVNGIFFSNELLDAFPVHRICWDASQQLWRELLVACYGDKFVWEKAELTFPSNDVSLPREVWPHLPDGFLFEVDRFARAWWKDAAAKLRAGKLMAIDYGFTVEDFLRSGKTGGTTRAYCQHRVTDDLLAHPGEQDLTAHVNFDSIRSAGEEAGLTTECFQSQSQFLTKIFEEALLKKHAFDWMPAELKQFQTLTSPEHLGRFRVLLQRR